MSRHQITVRSGNGSSVDEPRQRGHEVAVARAPLLVRKAEPVGRRPGARPEVGVVRLREVEQAPVVAEVVVEKPRVAVEPEPADDERLEVASKEVGEVEGRGLRVVQLLPRLVPGQEAVTVRTGEPLDAVLL
jgi:hypothetical protein